MLFSLRRIAPILLVAGLVFVAGCGSSNNKGKIAGKWKITGGAGMKADDLKMMDALGIYAYMEFTDAGALTFGAAANDPKMNEQLAKGTEGKTVACKYKLLSGDLVEIYDMPKEMQEKNGSPFGKKDKGRARVKIEGDNMTISDDETLKNDPMTLTKVK